VRASKFGHIVNTDAMIGTR